MNRHYIDTFQAPLDPELFEKFSFFDLYPFDGGGSFINHEIIGSVNDREYTQAVTENDALAEFGGFEETDFLKFERWRTIERSCWINRMYFIAPMAAWAKKSGDEKLARKVYDIMLRFGRTPEYAAPATQEATVELHREVLRRRDEEYNALGPEFDAAIPYQWFDFQPASRIIHMIHAMYFLRDFQLLSDEELDELEELIFIHVRNIYWGESGGIQLRPGNHQALRGLALMLGCAFFRGERGTDRWAATAEKICNFHILNDFLPDGMLIDLSPSYHFFECWITRDILLLADREHYHITPEARERAAKAFGICRALRQPDGFSPVISDGYPLDMEIFVRSLGKMTGACAEDLFLPDAGMAVKARPDGDFLLFDCSPLLHKLSHFHGGKQAPVLFLKGRCFLTDSGCCSYDDADFSAEITHVCTSKIETARKAASILGAKPVADFREITGSWKGLLRYSNPDLPDVVTSELVNFTVAGTSSDSSLTVDWYLIWWSGDGEWLNEEEMDDTVFSGSFTDGTLAVNGTGNIRLTAFYEWQGSQYAAGELDAPDGSTAVVGMVRP